MSLFVHVEAMSGHENTEFWAKRPYDVDDIYNRVPDKSVGPYAKAGLYLSTGGRTAELERRPSAAAPRPLGQVRKGTLS